MEQLTKDMSLPAYEAATAFLATRYASNCRPRTLDLYRRVVTKFVSHLGGMKITRARQVRPEHALSYLSKRRQAGVSGGTLTIERTTILGFCRWLSRSGQAPEFPWSEAVPRIMRDVRTPRFLSEEECRKFFAAVKHLVYRRERVGGLRDVAMIAMLVDSGVRAGELTALRVYDLDLADLSATVSEDSKGRRDRTVTYSQRTARLIRAYLRSREDQSADSPLWLTRRGTALCRVRLFGIVREVAKAAGLRDVNVRSLRHTAATLRLRYGATVTDVQRLLGHRRVETTMLYAHLVDDDVRQRLRESCPLDRIGGEDV
jgi:integrase/recombinase XerD